MHKLVSVLLILAFILPVPIHVRAEDISPVLDLKYSDPAKDAAFSSDRVKFAALDSADFVPVERKLIDEQMGKTQPKSTWWKWALGVLLVGGIAAAAGGGGGGSGAPAPAPTTGSVSTSW